MKTFVTAAALLPAIAFALPGAPGHLETMETNCPPAVSENLVFGVPIDVFEAARDSADPSDCNWTSDNCSWALDKPVGFNFTPSCHRHDFGYRNTKAQGRFTSEAKKKIDDNFKRDLYNYCSRFRGIRFHRGVECRRIADIYVAFVRGLGKREEMGFMREGSVLEIEFDGVEADAVEAAV